MKKNLVWIGVGAVLLVAAIMSRIGGGVLSTIEDQASYTAGYLQYRYVALPMDQREFEADLDRNFAGLKSPPFTAAYKIGARDARSGKDPAIDLTDGALLLAKLKLR